MGITGEAKFGDWAERIPIVSHMGVNGGVSILDEYKVDKRLFTTGDISALLIALSGVHTAMSGSDIAHALAKVRAMIPQETQREIERQSSQVAIDLSPWAKDTRFEPYMVMMKDAIAEHRVLSFEYTTASGITSSREVEPYRLLHKGDGWYVQGYCLLREEFRTFRFYRMHQLRMTDRLFEPRPFDPAELALDGSVAPQMVEVTIRFDASARSNIIGFYGDSVVEPCVDGMYLAKIMLFDAPAGYNMLLTLGEHCECLDPPHVREYIYARAKTMAALYEL